MFDYLFVPAAECVTTPFEDWCEAVGIHPEAVGAWEHFCAHPELAESA